MKRLVMLVLAISFLFFLSCGKKEETKIGIKTLPVEQLRDKIAGGWAGKIIGVSYGAPTEFRARAETYEDSIKWEPSMVKGALTQDDIYVQLSFMMTMDIYGIDAPTEKFAESFATAGYRLWHANVQARKNFFDGIIPPQSGSPKYSLHADDIDFQIEADYIGFMCPGMPQTATKIADKIGHIMNYGDGVYGGIFVGALYTEAFFESDIPTIVNRALLSIPAESDYAKCINDVVILHGHYPDDWRAAWKELENKWGDVDICGAGDPFNIDAKINGAYIVMGLLYGNGDFEKTMEVSTRCGQDSDCNPSNAAAVIGVITGLNAIPEKYSSELPSIADSMFIFTGYTFNTAVENTVKYAKELITQNGGEVTDTEVKIIIQEPVAPALEVSFPDVVFDRKSSVFDKDGWTWKGAWKDQTVKRGNQKPYKHARYTDKAGAEVSFTFNGTGVVINGDWKKDGGKADVYLDSNLNRNIDTYYWYAGEEKTGSFLWHVTGLPAGEHTLTLKVTGEKKPESEGANIYITGATVFKTEKKKNENFKFSFEK